MNVLADDIGRRTHLEVILLVNTRHQIGVVERYAIVRVSAEEKRFGRLGAGLGRSNVCPERQNPRLRKMPASFIKFQVKLKRSRFVGARRADGSTSVADAGIGEWSAGFARQAIQNEVRCSAIRLKARM